MTCPPVLASVGGSKGSSAFREIPALPTDTKQAAGSELVALLWLIGAPRIRQAGPTAGETALKLSAMGYGATQQRNGSALLASFPILLWDFVDEFLG